MAPAGTQTRGAHPRVAGGQLCQEAFLHLGLECCDELLLVHDSLIRRVEGTQERFRA
jgi:hypothetical protein